MHYNKICSLISLLFFSSILSMQQPGQNRLAVGERRERLETELAREQNHHSNLVEASRRHPEQPFALAITQSGARIQQLSDELEDLEELEENAQPQNPQAGFNGPPVRLLPRLLQLMFGLANADAGIRIIGVGPNGIPEMEARNPENERKMNGITTEKEKLLDETLQELSRLNAQQPIVNNGLAAAAAAVPAINRPRRDRAYREALEQLAHEEYHRAIVLFEESAREGSQEARCWLYRNAHHRWALLEKERKAAQETKCVIIPDDETTQNNLDDRIVIRYRNHEWLRTHPEPCDLGNTFNLNLNDDQEASVNYLIHLAQDIRARASWELDYLNHRLAYLESVKRSNQHCDMYKRALTFILEDNNFLRAQRFFKMARYFNFIMEDANFQLPRIIGSLSDDEIRLLDIALETYMRDKRIEQDYNERRAQIAAAATASSSAAHNCLICDENKHETYFVKLMCRHTFCRECLRTMITSALTEKSTLRLLCPDRACTKNKVHFASEDIRNISGEEALKKINEIKLLEALAVMPGVKHCPTSHCQNTFINENNEMIEHTCLACNESYCPACLLPHTIESTCEEYATAMKARNAGKAEEDKANEEFKAKNNIKACPRCRLDLEKTAGCDHIQCTRCGHHFCWICLKNFPKECNTEPHKTGVLPVVNHED